jgi:hypothetical protein
MSANTDHLKTGIPTTLPLFVVGAPTEGAVRRQAELAYAAGGGIVLLPVGVIAITSALPLYQNVRYQGGGVSFRMRLHDIAGGTIIDGGGGNFNGFEYNPDDSADNSVDPLTQEIQGAGLFDLGIRNCKYGVKVGALYKGGINNFNIDRICVTGCSQWGVWLENCHNQKIGQVVCFDNTVGQFCKMASGTTYWNYGNDTINDIICQASSSGQVTARGVVIGARDTNYGGSQLNDCFIEHITSIGNSNHSYTTQPTCTNGSPNLGVSDLTKFAVGIPVMFQTAGSGFSTNRVYFVKTVSGASGAGTITVATKLGSDATATNASATGNTPVVMVRGGACVEFGGQDANSTVTYSAVMWTDFEAGGCADIVCQNINTGTRIHFGIHSGLQTYTAQLVTRNCNAALQTFWGSQANLVDCDSPTVQIHGQKPTTSGNQTNNGLKYSGRTGSSALELHLDGKRANGQWFMDDPAFAHNPVCAGAPIREMVSWVADGVTWSGGTHGNFLQYTGTGGAGLTIPAITYAMVGIPIVLSNPTANSWTVTLNAANSVDNDGATTSITVLTHTTVVIQAASTVAHSGTTLAGTQYWAKLK